ncbi:aldose 1-epimerase [Henriciella mobilis]|uniref:aldose 1-epimerase n=1 Tax=Henriciella mobilis TaxID=2305467 RepID=UPI000E661ED0|nr:aldose 1-epimerase [Henriciella mobilis]RIJ13705.1 aldose 1-epimerase [Henriciella mobilis]RIJ21087.1 aldose 1-epimerase [Henriciella mobilis]
MPGTTELSDKAALCYLSAHGFDMAVQPGVGGRIVSLSFGGVDVFQPDARPDAMRVFDAGCFPLVPFSNRIRGGTFEFGGCPHTLKRNWDGDEHAIHGEGWTSAWTVTHQDDASIRMWMASAGWWPWTYECSQLIRLMPGRVSLSLKVTNLDTSAMPVGLGFHPYFPRNDQTQLQFNAAGMIEPMNHGPLQVEPLTPTTDFSQDTAVRLRDLDHGYAGWDGVAIIRQPEEGLEITVRTNASPAGAVVYIPPSAPFFCFEPVSQINGAFEMDQTVETGLHALKPGESLDFSVAIDVEKRPDAPDRKDSSA